MSLTENFRTSVLNRPRPADRPVRKPFTLPAWVRIFRESPLALAGALLLALHLLMAAVGPWMAPYSATEFHLADKLQPPSALYLLGTDQYGRDILSRILTGAPGILLLAGSATALGLLCGVIVGTVAAYYGGKLDEIIMRIMDAQMSFPTLILAMLVLTMIGPAVQNIVLAIALVFTPRVARVIRSVMLDLKTRAYVEAARLRGESDVMIMLRELLPNAGSAIMVEGAIRISYAILLGASLGFLGLGVQPPTPDWGLMISEARNYIAVAPWMVIFPSIAIASLVIGANLLADGLNRALELRGE
jgi:peptide/nickel transport system permease protein